MNAATAKRLIQKSGQTCSVVSYSSGTTDRYDNPVESSGTEVAGVPCFYQADQSVRLGDFINPDTQGRRDRAILYLPGDVEVDDDDVIESVSQAKYGGATINDGPLAINRVDNSLAPLLIILYLSEVE